MQYEENILIENISDFPNHPYKVIEDEKMQELVSSIKKNGVLNHVIVRKKKNS